MDETTADRFVQHVAAARRLQLERVRLQAEHDLAAEGRTMRLHSAALVRGAEQYEDTPESMRTRAAQYRQIARAYKNVGLAVRDAHPQVAATIGQHVAELIETASMWERRSRPPALPDRSHGCSHEVTPGELVVCVHGMTCAACFRGYCAIGQIIAIAETGGAQ